MNTKPSNNILARLLATVDVKITTGVITGVIVVMFGYLPNEI
jgi:hypothetical protein